MLVIIVTFNIFLQLFISNVQVVTNMSSGVTSNSKYTTYGSLRIGGQIFIPRTATTFTLRGFIESPVSTGKGDY